VRIEVGNGLEEVQEGTSTATCDPGEQVIGGIYDYGGSALITVNETIDIPSNSYSVEFVTDPGFEADFQASAICISESIT